MPELSLEEMVRATGGKLVRGEAGVVVSSFAIDTRALRPGGAFFALPGTHTDGHAFLGEAVRAGAAAAVVREDAPLADPAPPALLGVADPAEALTRCAARARQKMKDLRVVAVTGSTGKTLTKELIAAGLAAGHRVHRTPGNWNNHLGVPLSLLACPGDAEFAVLELGMSGPGEIAALSRLVRPEVALVTNVRPVHLQFFRTVDDIAAAKGELFATLSADGVAVINLEDEQVRVQSQRHAGRRVTFGRNGRADLRLGQVRDCFLPGTSFTFHHGDRERSVELRMSGEHAAWNALGALAAIVATDGDLDEAARAMAGLEPGPGRGRIHLLADRVALVDESYNSNPAALASVLRTLGKSPADGGRKVLVLGDMLELGREETSFHREAGRQIAAAGVRLLFAVGRLAHVAAEAARRAGVPEIHQHHDSPGAARELPECLLPGDLVVVKGSRGSRLETVVDAVLEAKRGLAAGGNGPPPGA